MFGTYRPEPREGHLGMTIGIEAFRDLAELRLDRMLTQPFRDDPAARSASGQGAAPQPGPTLADRG
jgi:hypothetical protein